MYDEYFNYEMIMTPDSPFIKGLVKSFLILIIIVLFSPLWVLYVGSSVHLIALFIMAISFLGDFLVLVLKYYVNQLIIKRIENEDIENSD